MTNTGQITLNRGNYFPPNVYFVGIIGIIVGIILLFLSQVPALGVAIILVTSPLWLLKKGITIDPDARTIKDHKQFLFIKMGETKPYNTLISLRLKTDRMSQTMSSRGSSSTIHYTLYSIILQTNRDKFTLKSSKNRDKVAIKLEELSTLLNCPIYN